MAKSELKQANPIQLNTSVLSNLPLKVNPKELKDFQAKRFLTKSSFLTDFDFTSVNMLRHLFIYLCNRLRTMIEN
jgi:hypothetical protein